MGRRDSDDWRGWKDGKYDNRYSRNNRRNRNKTKSVTVGIVFLLIIGVFGFILLEQGYLDESIQNTPQEIQDISKTVKNFAIETTEKLSETINEQLEDISFEYTPTPTSVEESKENIQYINQIRQENGRKPIAFDQRAYDLALARVQDVNEYNYFEHTNPFTGTCADTWKHSYSFPSNQYVAENLADGVSYPDSAVDLWMTSPGHKDNLLWSTHSGGATVCELGTCVFLGVNIDRFGAGCY